MVTTQIKHHSSLTNSKAKAAGGRTSRALATLLSVGVAVAGSLVLAAPSSAVPSATPSCTQTEAGVLCSVSFSFTGAEQEYIVPAGITSIKATAIGAKGGQSVRSGVLGGNGASVSGSFTVIPGQPLFVEVGGTGSNWIPGGVLAPGGFNGGGDAPPYYGNGGSYDLGGGAGGGASDVRTSSATDPGTLASRLVIAGGGGGGGLQGAGGGAGMPGGVSNYGSAGGAGTAGNGGAGGIDNGHSNPSGSAGTLGRGGNGSTNGGGGGGGGGLYGGGGASVYGGGGGGSSLGVDNGLTSSPASVTLTYVSTVVDLAVTAAATTVAAGTATTFSATGTDSRGDSWNATASTTFTSSDSSDTVTGNGIQFGKAGPRTITATDQGVSITMNVTVMIGPESGLMITPQSPSIIAAGGTATFTTRAMDAGGNDLGDATSATTFTSSNTSDVITGNSIRFGTAGPRTVTANDGIATTSTTVVVTVGPMATMTVSASATSVVAGDTATFTAAARDAGNNDLGDVTGATTFTSSNGTDTVTGNSIRFGTAGPRTITGTNGATLATTGVTATVGTLASIKINPSAVSVVAGSGETFGVTGFDSEANSLGDLTTRATFTSNATVDVIDGSKITFMQPGTRVITATVGSLKSSTTIEVSAAPVSDNASGPATTPVTSASTLASTGFDHQLPFLGGVAAMLLGLLSMLIITRRRRSTGAGN